MFQDQQLLKVLLCLGLEAAALMGAPVRPEEIENLLRNARQAGVEVSIHAGREDSDDPVQRDLETNFSGPLPIDGPEVSR